MRIIPMTSNPFDLTGRVAIVTGGNGGIGLGMARGMAAAGAGIVVAARNREKSERAVTDEAAVARLLQATLQRFGRVDVLVNNAGTNIRKPPQDLALAEWRAIIDV